MCCMYPYMLQISGIPEDNWMLLWELSVWCRVSSSLRMTWMGLATSPMSCCRWCRMTMHALLCCSLGCVPPWLNLPHNRRALGRACSALFSQKNCFRTVGAAVQEQVLLWFLPWVMRAIALSAKAVRNNSNVGPPYLWGATVCFRSYIFLAMNWHLCRQAPWGRGAWVRLSAWHTCQRCLHCMCPWLHQWASPAPGERALYSRFLQLLSRFVLGSRCLLCQRNAGGVVIGRYNP